MIFLNPKTILSALASASLISGGTAFVPSWKNAPRGAMELRAVMSVPPEAGIIADKMNAFLVRCEEEETKCALELEERKAAILNEFIEQERDEILQEVQEMANKKDLEIENLKQQLDDLVAQQQQEEAVVQEEETPEEPISADPTVLALSKEELIDKVKSYQALVSKYTEDAAQQQARAVQVAEDSLTQKYEAQLKALGYVEEPPKEETSSNDDIEAASAPTAAETEATETNSETPELVQSIESAATADLHQAPPPSAPEKKKTVVAVSSIPPLPQIQPDKFLRNV